MKLSSLIALSVALAAAPGVSAQSAPTLPSPVSGPACVASGKWKGTLKTPVLISADGHRRMYGWLEWDRPGKWTGKRCEANWWVFASHDGDKFRPVLARQDLLEDGEQPSLAVSEFSPDARWAAADAMTASTGKTRHGYFVADLAENTSCFGSAVKGLDGVRSELTFGREPFFQQLIAVRDDGWLQLSVHAQLTPSEAETGRTRSGRKLLFEPCSSKLRIEKAQ